MVVLDVLLLAPPGPPPSWAEVRTYLRWQHFSVAAFCYGVASRALHWAEGGFVAMGKADSATRLGRWKRWAYAKGSEWATATVGPTRRTSTTSLGSLRPTCATPPST